MIYLDNSATTRVLDSSADIAHKYMTQSFFNPAGAYTAAVEIERSMNGARQHMAEALLARPDELLYTSGGTESNNMSILGSLKHTRAKGRIICSAVEHPSVYEVFHDLKGSGYDVAIAPVTNSGELDYGAFLKMLTPDTQFVSVMHVNNETGVINDIARINDMVKSRTNAIFHSDGVQAFCKLGFYKPECDLYSISGHKFHAPKGIGALYVKKGTRFAGGQIGGGQERNLRSGTSNVPSIMAMDNSLMYYRENSTPIKENMTKLRKRLADNLLRLPDVMLNGVAEHNAPHILNASFLGVRGEVILHTLADKGVFVSTGSACSSRKKGSRVLEAMGIKGDRSEGAVRFSLCPFNTIAEIDTACNIISEILPLLRRYKRR